MPGRAARPMASAVDVDGNLWCGWGMGLRPSSTACAYSIRPAKPIGHIDLPERAANLCFGGRLPQPAVHRGEPFALRPLRQPRRASPAADRKNVGVIDSGYAWRRLAASVALSTVGGIGHVVAWPSLCRRCRSISGVQPRRHLLRLHHEYAGLLRRRRSWQAGLGRSPRHRLHLDPERRRPLAGLCGSPPMTSLAGVVSRPPRS